jgi:hypothetical protein
MAPADQHQLIGCAVEALGEPGQVVEQVLRGENLAVRSAENLGDLRRMRRVLSDRLEATARSQLAEWVGEAVADGTACPGISADTIMDVIAGGAWYAVCVRRIKDVDTAAKELSELVLHGVLAGR